ncbi:protein of unknown function [Burkholderia multivorans]
MRRALRAVHRFSPGRGASRAAQGLFPLITGSFPCL